MTFRKRGEPALFAAGVALCCLLFRSRGPYDLDSVNFVLGMRRFDPATHQPHPPGYFLYILLGRAVNLLVNNENLALILVSVAASCGVVMLIYSIALQWFGREEARCAAVLYLVSPLAWFHGTVALTYAVESFFSALLGLLCWRIVCGELRWLIPAAVALGVAAGVRPSSLLLLGPLYLYALLHASRAWRLAGVAALVCTVLAWSVPMLAACGGLHAYLSPLYSLWRRVPSQGTVFNSSPATTVNRLSMLALIYVLCFGTACIAPLGARRIGAPLDRRMLRFTAAWVGPGLAFFAFIFLKFVNSGYLLLVVPAGCLWLGAWAWARYKATPWPRWRKHVAVAVCIGVNISIFLFSPFYCSYRSVRSFERDLDAMARAMPAVASAQTTLVVGFDLHFFGFRHAGYSLPAYLTVQYPAIELEGGRRIFAMHNGGTALLSAIPAGQFNRFVLFPIPSGNPELQQYRREVLAHIPLQDQVNTESAGYTFTSVPIRDLPLLFPSPAP